MWRRVYRRSQEWMDSLPLLESSLRTCPRFAKGHLEISKIYSGLYPDQYNLTRARWHLEQVEEIDPNYCDVHQQFAHVAVQEGKLVPEFEERLVQALLCPYTMSGAIGQWQKYWQVQLDPQQNAAAVVQENERRHQAYQVIINQAIADEAAREETKKQQKKRSPLAINWNAKDDDEL